MKGKMKLCITGGGSGGHLNTALGMIEFIQKEDSDTFEGMFFIGGTRGMIDDPSPSLESQQIPFLGVKFVGIRSGKLHRKFSLGTLKLLWGVFGGFIDSWRVLRKERPDIILATGGYVTVPVIISARLMGIPTIIHEQTITAGLANKINSKFANKILVTFSDSVAHFPKNKTEVVGNIIRASRFDAKMPGDIAPDYAEFLRRAAAGRKDYPFILLTGGGLGSHKLSNWVRENLKELTEKYHLLVQTGSNKIFADYEKLESEAMKLPEESRSRVYVTERFAGEIGFIYANTDLVIGRAGANTVLELLATNNRAILVPIKWSAGNEQQKNAEFFVNNQVGRIISEEQLERILPEIPATIAEEKKDSSGVVSKTAAEDIYSEILEVVTLERKG